MKFVVDVSPMPSYKFADMSNNTQRKTSKKALREAVDSFLWRYDWLTGGTREEIARQAEDGRNLADLQSKAEEIARLAANASKPCAADSHLMDYALRMVPLKLSLYAGKTPGTPEFEAKQAEAAKQEQADRAAFRALQASEALTASLPSKIIPFPVAS